VILPRIDGDTTKAEELDDVMLNAGISCFLPAQKIIRQVLRKWKYLSSFSGVENFLHPVLSGLHLLRSGLKGARRFVGSIFKLKTSSRAILSESFSSSRTTGGVLLTLGVLGIPGLAAKSRKLSQSVDAAQASAPARLAITGAACE
jgi:hypothetical protein